ncbi:MAG: prepilin-type N-terminal cleavage/methylation domain-containing protein, partial [Cyanobacteria bacterium SIG26]|nr:prepilin-type N-terminal cleavage/methylation domain-containing protein [Cyanobacteria bacterium SIG26]
MAKCRYSNVSGGGVASNGLVARLLAILQCDKFYEILRAKALRMTRVERGEKMPIYLPLRMTRVERGGKMPIYSPHAEHIGIASYTTVGSNIYPPRGDRRGFANSLAKKAAFTLGEVLIAVAVVGVIAGLVLPSVVNHFQTKTLASAQTRLQDTLQDSVKSLTVTENAEDIRQTMLYVPDDTSLDGLSDFSDSSVKFMNKYLKLSKMCDSSTIG